MKTIHHIIRILPRPLVALIAMLPATAGAQYNCTILKDSSAARACRLYNASDSFAQGGPKCERYLDSAIAICPAFAPAWHERSVPYLKRGDFVTWRRYLDKAVALDSSYLAYRGWCRALGHYQAAFAYFDKAFGADSSQAGLYGYLHLGTTRLLTEDYRGAIAALDHENRIYDKFAETWSYLARANLALGHNALAKAQFLQAKALLTDPTGKYYLHEVYCEMQDAVYLSDIQAAPAGLQP